MSTHAFDPDDAALEGTGIFGLPQNSDTALVHVVRVPFDATTSYRKGAAFGPDAVERASRQVELFDPLFGKPYLRGIYCGEADPRIGEWNGEASDDADPIIAVGGAIGDDKRLAKKLARVNELGQELNEHVHGAVAELLARGKLPCVLGGDHSVPFGAIRACAERHPGLGLLHFDAHADLRQAYEGFTWSHASIMHNVSERIGGVAKLVQIGLRDVGEREFEYMQHSEGRIETLFDSDWQQTKLDGGKLRELARAWIARLPAEVYVSFDIDGLDPVLCPNTGTPVPGGLSWNEALLWLEVLARSKKRVVGLDLNEVSPGPGADAEIDSWDAIVGARLLYRMIGSALVAR